jgi:hypothetical protein
MDSDNRAQRDDNLIEKNVGLATNIPRHVSKNIPLMLLYDQNV